MPKKPELPAGATPYRRLSICFIFGMLGTPMAHGFLQYETQSHIKIPSKKSPARNSTVAAMSSAQFITPPSVSVDHIVG
jgi:hypothetical protein